MAPKKKKSEWSVKSTTLPSVVAIAVVVLFCTSSMIAQQPSSSPEELPPAMQRVPITLENGSWYFTPPTLPRRIAIYDRVTVRVDELARMQSEGDAERRKNAQYDAVLQDWVHLIGLKALKPNAQNDGDQRIKAQLQQLYRAESDVETRESLALNIACTVADVRPNGDLVLEGHKQIRINDNVWEVSVTGICRNEDVGPDNVVLSRNIVNLRLDKRERGQVRDGYKRGWFTRWFDEFHPF